MYKNIEMYLDYWNNFLTIERFAEYYSITELEAINIINKGKEQYNGQTNSN